MSKWLRIFCIALTFTLSGFHLYKTTTGAKIIDLLCTCGWFVCGIINCLILFNYGVMEGLEIEHEIVMSASKKNEQEVGKINKELEESEEEDES